MPIFEYQTSIPVSPDKLFDWHERVGAFERLTPPWEKIEVIHKDPNLNVGSELSLKLKLGPFSILWVCKHIAYTKGKEFIDQQVKGPFASWQHHHKIEPQGHSSIMKDRIQYEMRFGIGKAIAEKSLKKLFIYRHEILAGDLGMQEKFPVPPMTIAITGATGLIGKELAAFLSAAGHRVILVSHSRKSGSIYWNPKTGEIESSRLEGIDAMIHLAGENIASNRWGQSKKKRIYESRVLATRSLVEVLNKLKHPPKVLISASAIGYYGIHSGQIASEKQAAGTDFLAKVCRDWEEAAHGYTKGRVVTPRFGTVLSLRGGALSKMILPFKLGLGGKIGSGKQMISWIAIDDLIYNLYAILCCDSFSGPINFTSPNPVSNDEFTQILARVIRRPSFLPLPSWMVSCLFGEMGRSTLLSDIEAYPETLIKGGGQFYYPDLEKALRHLIGISGFKK